VVIWTAQYVLRSGKLRFDSHCDNRPVSSTSLYLVLMQENDSLLQWAPSSVRSVITAMVNAVLAKLIVTEQQSLTLEKEFAAIVRFQTDPKAAAVAATAGQSEYEKTLFRTTFFHRLPVKSSSELDIEHQDKTLAYVNKHLKTILLEKKRNQIVALKNKMTNDAIRILLEKEERERKYFAGFRGETIVAAWRFLNGEELRDWMKEYWKSKARTIVSRKETEEQEYQPTTRACRRVWQARRKQRRPGP
jgi:hypothetical protein